MRTRTRFACLSIPLILSALATGARATPSIAVEATPPDRRTEVDVGFIVGGEDVGPSRRYTRGLQVDIGRRFGDLVLLAEYNYLGVGDDSSGSTGTMSRGGLVARYSLLRTSGDPDHRGRRGPLSGDFWLEGGAGVQRIAWDAGGVLTRPDAVLGVGWQLNGVIGRDDPHPRYYGPYVALRVHLTRAPEPGADVMPTCGGPCDRATRPSRNNVGFFFHFGINWGR